MYLQQLEPIETTDLARLAGRAAGWVSDHRAAELWKEAHASDQLPRLREEAETVLSWRE